MAYHKDSPSESQHYPQHYTPGAIHQPLPGTVLGGPLAGTPLQQVQPHRQNFRREMLFALIQYSGATMTQMIERVKEAETFVYGSSES